MENHVNPFRNAGIALLAIGVIDIGVMVYWIANEINYSSSFNIFAVGAGIFLIKGSVKTARIVRWLSVFFAIVFIGVIITTPFTTPFGLILTQLKINTLSTVGLLAFGLVFIAILIWTLT